MSSSNDTQTNSFTTRTWNPNFIEEGNSHRSLNPVAESRVLSMFLKNEQESKANHEDCKDTLPGHKQQSPESSHKSQQLLTLPEITSQLSVDAQEFVPRSKAVFLSDSYPSQNFNPDDGSSLSVTAPEFVPRVPEEYIYSNPNYTDIPQDGFDPDSSYLLENFNTMTLRDQYEPLYPCEPSAEIMSDIILERFNKALNDLKLHPGLIEAKFLPICDMLQSSTDSAVIVDDVVESLFNQSVQEKNFWYTGARICQFLDSTLKDNLYFSGFSTIFIKRCLNECNRRDELKNGNSADRERLRGLAMFMAEIFLNVEVDAEDGTVQPVQYLPGILIDLLNVLLSKPSDLDIQCSFQLLKLSGGFIEDVVKHSPEHCIKFEDVFTQLQSLQTNHELTENSKFLIDTIIKLKDSDWNRNSSSPPTVALFSQTSEPDNLEFSESIFYNHMGVAYNPGEFCEDGAYVLNDDEEDDYLAWQAEQEWQSYQIDEIIDGEVGEEIEAANEGFLHKPNILQDYQSLLPGVTEQLIYPPVQHIFTHPPPNMTQNCNSFPQQPVPASTMQQNPVPPQYNEQQQSQYQSRHLNDDQFHYQR